jgi:molybdopterin-guanine dinucleotide biosynthesis protein A
MTISAIILTGGSSTRFGSDKTQALLGEKTIVAHIVDSLPREWPIIIVGPTFVSQRSSLYFTREEPIGGGPVYALAAGLRLVSTAFVAVIAGDMPFAARALTELIDRQVSKDGLVLLDQEGFRQTLCAIYRTSSLESALSSMDALEGKSMRNLVDLLNVEEISLAEEFASSLLDIDTLEDLTRAKNESRYMEAWLEAVRKELGVSVNVDTNSILEVARDAAHAVERKAAPMTTFLLGYAVAQGADITKSVEKIARLAKEWPAAE